MDDFTDLLKDFIKSDNNIHFENVTLKLFNIVEKEIKNSEKDKKEENEKKYFLRLKEEYQKEVDNIRNELNKYNHHKEKNSEIKTKKSKTNFFFKKKDSHISSKSSKKMKGKMLIEEKNQKNGHIVVRKK